MLSKHIAPAKHYVCTGKSLSEALILASNNPQYGDRLFMELPIQYMKTTSSEHVVYINCFEIQNKIKNTACTELVVFVFLNLSFRIGYKGQIFLDRHPEQYFFYLIRIWAKN